MGWALVSIAASDSLVCHSKEAPIPVTRIHHHLGLAAAAAVIWLFGAAAAADAANFLVDNTSVDLGDLVPGDGECSVGPAAPLGQRCTLRAAVQEANATPDADVVVIPTLTAVTLTQGEIMITGSLAVGSLGSGDFRPIVSAGGSSRIFRISPFPGATEFRFVNLRLRDGWALGGNPENSGAAVYIPSGNYTLAIEGCDLTNNTAGAGGAILAGASDVRITDSLFRNNVLADPQADVNPFGAALWANSFGGTLTIERSTFAFNGSTRASAGQAITASRLAEVRIENSTISGNGRGGVWAIDADLVLRNVTVGRNLEAGIALTSTGPSIVLDAWNSIIAENDEGCVRSGSTSSLTAYNLDEDGTCGFFPGGGTLVGVAARLAALADNGGPTPTHRLRSGSPALDAGSPAAPGNAGACLTLDQRGEPRPQPATPGSSSRCDMGAIEAPEPAAGALGLTALATLVASRPRRQATSLRDRGLRRPRNDRDARAADAVL